MRILIPMAGRGDRFVNKGYKNPKPLIKVNGKMIIEYILDMFDENDDITFICNDTHLQNTDMKKILNEEQLKSKFSSKFTSQTNFSFRVKGRGVFIAKSASKGGIVGTRLKTKYKKVQKQI